MPATARSCFNPRPVDLTGRSRDSHSALLDRAVIALQGEDDAEFRRILYEHLLDAVARLLCEEGPPLRQIRRNQPVGCLLLVFYFV